MDTNANSHFQEHTEPESASHSLLETHVLWMTDEQTTHAFIALDLQWQVVYLNQQAKEVLRRTRGELLGKNLWEALPDYVGSPLYDYCRQAVSSDKAAQFEVKSPRSPKWFRVNIFPSPGEISIFFTEITAWKEAEERLRQSEKRFRALIENSTDGIALTDEKGIITYASPSTARMVGYFPEEFIGGRIFGRDDYPDGGEATRRLMARIQQEPRKSQVLEFRTPHKDGTLLWMEITGINLLDEPGVEAIVWNFRDVTQRKQLEQKAAAAKEQLEVILQNVADGITVVDANDRLVYVNDVVAHWRGFPSLAALLAALQAGKVHRHEKFATWDQWGRPLPGSERPTAKALQGKQAQALLRYQDNATGQFYWNLVRAHPIFDAQGQVQFVVTVYTDVTEQKELELRKDHFISMASHELKTPLTILSAYTQLLHERFAAEGRQDAVLQLSKMDDQITDLTRLVTDLLDISKMQAGQLDLVQEAVDMDGLVREVVENLQPTTTRHLLIEGTARRPVIGDRGRLGQVLINLLTNAIKYSPHADTVVIKVIHTHHPHETLTVSVQDFGIGISQSHQQRLFERFYRVLSEKDQNYPGLGIGLYIAHEIISRHGGRMWVESAEGKGSTFFFSLSVREAKESVLWT